MNFPKITLDEETGEVTYKMDPDVAIELSYVLTGTIDKGWRDDGTEMFRLAFEWGERRS